VLRKKKFSGYSLQTLLRRFPWLEMREYKGESIYIGTNRRLSYPGETAITGKVENFFELLSDLKSRGQ